MKYLLTLISLLFFLESYAQQNPKKIAMEKDPQPYIPSAEYEDESAIIVNDDVKFRYYLAGNSVKLKKYVHKKIHLGNELAVEQFNTLKIPFSESYRVNNIQIRTIKADGTVDEVDSDDIEEGQLENGIKVKLIAFENVDVGDDIEFYYVWDYPYDNFNTYLFASEIPTINSYMEVQTPSGLSTDFIGYNGIEFYQKEDDKGLHTYVYLENLQPVKDEIYAYPLQSQPRIEYSLSQNSGSSALYTWKGYDNTMYSQYSYMDKKDQKQLKKLLNKINLSGNANTDIFLIEDYVKTTFQPKESDANFYRSVDEIISSNEIYEDEIVRLLGNLYTLAGYNYQIGFNTNRSQKIFDSSFVNWDNLEMIYFYFPQQKTYLAPQYFVYRSPYIPTLMRANNSVAYLKPQEKSSSFRYNKLPLTPIDENYHNHNVKIHFNDEVDSAIVETIQKLGGEMRLGVTPYFNLLQGDERDEVVKQMIAYDQDMDNLQEYDFSGYTWKDLNQKKPIVIESKVVASSMIDPLGGGEFMFHIGEVIGKQTEIPEIEDERLYDIDLDMVHSYKRNIEMEIPQGYQLKNVSALNMNKTVGMSNNKDCHFISSAEVIGNKLQIQIDESYEIIHLPKKDYDSFKEVINAAADFNKVELLMEKL